MNNLPGDVICGHLLPYLSVRAMQALDSAFDTHLRRVWPRYTYDRMDDVLSRIEIMWLGSVGVQIVGVVFAWAIEDELEEIVTLLSTCSTLRKISTRQYISRRLLLQLVRSCSQLEVLRIASGKYFDDDIAAITQHCHQLHTLHLWSFFMSEIAIYTVCNNCPHLHHITCNNLTDACLITIAIAYPHLQSISIGYDATDAGLLAIADKCHELTSVIVDECRSITSRGLAALWAANPTLTDVEFWDNRFISDDDIMVLLQCCSHLKKLVLCECCNITDAAVIAVAQHYPQLTSLNISCCDDISDDALIALGQHCHGLKSINISQTNNISDVGILALAAGCPLLQEFIAGDTEITHTGVIALARGCRDLRKIDICSSPFIGLKAVSAIAKICPLISELDLSYCESVDDICLYVIAEHCRNLTKLYVNKTKVSYTAAKAVAIGNDCLKIFWNVRQM